MSGVRIYLLDALVINDVRPVIRIDGSRYQFHLCSNVSTGILFISPSRRTSGEDHTLHSEIAPDAHPPPTPERPEPPSHFRLLLLAGFEPAFGLPGFRVREDVRAAVERVGLRTDAHAGG